MAWVDPPTWDADDPWLHTDANQYVTDNTEYLYGQLSNIFVLNEMSTTPVVINNTTAWTNVVTFAVEADELAGANGFKVKIWFEFDNSFFSGAGFAVRLKYGGTTLASVSSDGLTQPNTAYGIIDALLWETAENTQEGILQEIYMTASSFNQPDYPVSVDGGTGAVDSSEARNLEIDVQLSAASANLTWTMKFYHIHKLTAA